MSRARRIQTLLLSVSLHAIRIVAVLATPLAASGEPGRGVLSFGLEPRDGKALEAPVPLTFGVAFRPGDLARGRTVGARLGNEVVPVQLDPKRSHSDGSLKHGVVSFVLPRLEATGGRLDLSVSEPSAEAAPSYSAEAMRRVLASDFEAVVAFTFPDGRSVRASARRMLETSVGKAEVWLDGPVAVEWLVSGAPTDPDGKADPDLVVGFHVRRFSSTGAVRISAVVEKCSDAGSDGGLVYDVSISRGRVSPEAVFERRSLSQPDLTRWRKVFWLGREPPGVAVRHDAVALAAAGVIPIYDFGIQVPERALEEEWKRWQAARKDLFENGLLTAYFGTTGGRPDLGPLPAWTAVYLLSMDPRQEEVMLGNDELSGGIPIHARSAATGRAPSWEERPRLWLADSRAGKWGTEKLRLRPEAPRTPEPVRSIFSPDCAHLPSLGYVPYVITGDPYFLEECYFWAAYVVFHDNPGYAKGLLYDGQLRGRAWGLRTVATAAAIAPDSHSERVHLSRRVEETLKSYLALLGGPEALPLGMLADERRGKTTTYAPWQHDYMVLATDFAALCGFSDAGDLLPRLLDFSLGRFSNAPDFDPFCAAGYWWTIADEETGFRCTTWKELGERNCTPKGDGRAEGSRDSRSSIAANDYAGGYSDLALATATIGERVGHAGGATAREFLLRNLQNVVAQRPANPPFAMGIQEVRAPPPR